MKTITILLISILAISCTSGNDTTEADDTKAVTVNDSEPLNYETVADGNRLTEKALQSFIPETVLNIKKEGEPNFTTSEPDQSHGGVNIRMTQPYYKATMHDASLTVIDYADDQDHINSIKKGVSMTNNEMSKMYTNDQGWIIMDMNMSRKRILNVQNPRFTVEVSVRRPELPSHEEMLEWFNNSNLPRLMVLPVPEGEVANKKVETNKVTLNCDEILPLATVESMCNVAGIKVTTTSFEGDTNCNRVYKWDENFSGTALIITQYSDPSQATMAVETKLNDDGLDVKAISGLGSSASLVTVGEDLFLSVAHHNYLIELRPSYAKLSAKDRCCICLSEESITQLAGEVINNLPVEAK